MKTQIKDIVIGIFAVIGFAAVVMGFTNNEGVQQPILNLASPESHVYEMHCDNDDKSTCFIYNKRTGRARVLEYSMGYYQSKSIN
tara:strand:+ start:73 stop:327 length:255 start_codon:yes stop_codon:yes gene_type:complete